MENYCRERFLLIPYHVVLRFQSQVSWDDSGKKPAAPCQTHPEAKQKVIQENLAPCTRELRSGASGLASADSGYSQLERLISSFIFGPQPPSSCSVPEL